LIKSKENAIKPESFIGIIRFEDVTFAYPKDKTKLIFNKFNLTIDAQHIAFIGRSGLGKSTILQLVMRYYDPDEGAVFLDGIDIRDLDLDWLRGQIGYVGQEPVLFATSIRENLLLAKADASEDEIQ
jgi:ATP-binding cassette, subfamily B (MDR/TAP), member 1